MPLERWKRAARAGCPGPADFVGRRINLLTMELTREAEQRFRNVESSLLLFLLPHPGGNVWCLLLPSRCPLRGRIYDPCACGATGERFAAPDCTAPKPPLCIGYPLRVRGGGTSAHTGIGRVVTGSHKLAEDADEDDPGCRRSSPMISSNSADRLQPLSRSRDSSPRGEGFGRGAVEQHAPTFPSQYGSKKRTADDS